MVRITAERWGLVQTTMYLAVSSERQRLHLNEYECALPLVWSNQIIIDTLVSQQPGKQETRPIGSTRTYLRNQDSQCHITAYACHCVGRLARTTATPSVFLKAQCCIVYDETVDHYEPVKCSINPGAVHNPHPYLRTSLLVGLLVAFANVRLVGQPGPSAIMTCQFRATQDTIRLASTVRRQATQGCHQTKSRREGTSTLSSRCPPPRLGCALQGKTKDLTKIQPKCRENLRMQK